MSFRRKRKRQQFVPIWHEAFTVDLNGVNNLLTGTIRTALVGCRYEITAHGTTEVHVHGCGHRAPGWLA